MNTYKVTNLNKVTNLKFLVNFKAILVLSFIALSVTVQADLSDKLPLALVRQLSNEKSWSAEMDSSANAKSQEIQRTLQLIKTEKNIETIVDSLMDTNFTSANNNLYLVKIAIFRYFLENSNEANVAGYATAKLVKIESAWKKRYVDSAASLLRQVNLPEYHATIDAFLQKLKVGAIQIYDLSPISRSKFDQEMGASHGASLLTISDNKYAVNGFYYSKKHLFALDFSRPLGETIITFAHEIIHAADPNLVTYRQDFDSYYPQVKTILNKMLHSNKGDELTGSLLTQVFFELGREELLAKIQEQSQQLAKNLQKTFENTASAITADEQVILRKWVRAVIGLSIENEYKAYGYSVVVYAHLKDKLNLIQSSQDRERFVAAIVSGDQSFAGRVSQSVNPFQNTYRAYQQLVSRFALNENEKLALDQCMHLIESLYLDEVRIFMASLNDQFSRLLKERISVSSSAAPIATGNHYLPEWTKAENFDSPANPYSLITARVSTMWAIRVKENILGLIKEMSEMRKSLLVLRAGILDFHDLSFNDFQFLNVVDANAEAPADLQQCSFSRNNFAGVDAEKYRKYFGTQVWNPNLLLSENSLAAEQLLEKLLKVKLIQSLAWFDKGFPDIKNNIVGAKIFIQKLREELYDSEDLSRERAAELQTELGEAIAKSAFTGQEVQKIQYLLKLLTSAYKISVERQWSIAAQEFAKKQTQILKVLSVLGLDISFDAEEFEQSWQQTFDSFGEQIEAYQDDCKNVEATYTSALPKPIMLGDDVFKINYICSAKEIYLLRMPCDNTQGLSVMTRNKKPLLSPLYNSRYVELIPFSRLSVR